jgi:hypothetical protein
MMRETRLVAVSLISFLLLVGFSFVQNGASHESNSVNSNRRVSFGTQKPGRLETVILRSPESIQRHELGSLTPPGTAQFFAVAAIDPLSHRIVKGLEVQFEGDDPLDENGHCKSTIYLDEEGLAEFQWELEKSVKSELSDAKRASEWSAEQLRSLGHPSRALNRDPGEERYYLELVVNYYWRGAGNEEREMFGVSFLWSKAYRTDQLRMPNANIRDVLKIVRDGRAWLAQNPADTPPADAGVSRAPR